MRYKHIANKEFGENTTPCTRPLNARMPPPSPTTTQETKQINKKRVAQSDALVDGFLLPHEITDGVMQHAADRQQRKVANDAKRARRAQTLGNTMAKPQDMLKGARVCIKGCDMPDRLPTEVGDRFVGGHCYPILG